MKNVKIRESLKVGWVLFMKRPWYLLGLSLLMGVVLFVTSSDSMLATALACIVYGGYLAALFNHYKGDTIVADDIFMLDSRWISFAFVIVIKTLLILVGLLCFVVPGVYLAVRWMFAEFLVIDRGMRPFQALKASSVLTEGHRWKLFFFSLIVVLLFFVGLVFFIVGAVIVGIVCTFACIKIYFDLQQETASEPSM